MSHVFGVLTVFAGLEDKLTHLRLFLFIICEVGEPDLREGGGDKRSQTPVDG